MEAKFIYHRDKINLNIKPTETVHDIRERLSYELGQLAQNVHLKYQNKTLEDEEILQKCISDPEVAVVIECDDDLSSDEEESVDEVNTDHFELNPQSEFEIPSYTPPDFDSKVNDLLELTGETDKEKCQRALRLAFFNADRAAEYLLSGEELPERPTILPFADSGINYKPMPDRSQSQALKDFTDDQINDLQKIMNETNTDFSTAVQVFIACSKNVENTMTILQADNK